MDNLSVPESTKRALADLVYREDLYPRNRVDPAKVQEYAACIELLPPIEINQNNIIIDGVHRYRAHQSAKCSDIAVTIIQTASEKDLLWLAVIRNARHGLILSQEDKRRLCVAFFLDNRDQTDVCSALAISRQTWDAWTKTAREQRAEEERATILNLHLRCWTQDAIAEKLGIPQKTVGDQIADFSESANFSDSAIFRNFDQDENEESGRRIYDVWNFAKAKNEVKIFGNIPPEIIDNLLYLYTNPFDIVFDPFGGGGSTYDICMKRSRRCWISDLTVRPERQDDIRQHDITTGLGLRSGLVPDLVFLDPPYWQQAKGRYSEEPTDLGNMELEPFLGVLGDIARRVKRKWVNAQSGGWLACIIGPWKQDGRKVHLPYLVAQRIGKYLELEEWISVPYSTEIHGGAFVKMAKTNRELLYLNRHLMVFGYEHQ